MMNNADWLRTIGLLEFLRDTGKHFTVNYMMAKESVKRRLGGDEGISFTEFSYLCCRRMIICTCIASPAARCRWAAAISGGTSWRVAI
jgi:hypothetical protein